MLKKDLTLYERDEEGILLPQERPLLVSEQDLKDYPDLADQTISIIPLKRGELQKHLRATGNEGVDVDKTIILQCCVNPKYTEEEYSYLKPVYIRSIATTILDESGVKFNGGKKSIKANDEFGKNSKELGKSEKQEA